MQTVKINHSILKPLEDYHIFIIATLFFLLNSVNLSHLLPESAFLCLGWKLKGWFPPGAA